HRPTFSRTTRLKMSARAVFLAAIAILTMVAGCTHVAPYDRARLADPNMTRLDLDGPAAEHVYAVHEGAAGGGAVAESGCGCN
ncbi:MAG: DUF4266 domain-containing protein, partial [Polyangiaceae bacterium]